MWQSAADLWGEAPPVTAPTFPEGEVPLRRALGSRFKRRGFVPILLATRISGGKTRMISLNVNGMAYRVDVDPETPLLWALRDGLGLTGTKYGCGIGECGACTVHVDGVATRSCSVSAGAVAGKKVLTIEGLAARGVFTKVQKAWVEHDVPQCGYCQSGMIMAVTALLKEKPKPTDADIDSSIKNICRCGTYQQVRAAIHAVAGL